MLGVPKGGNYKLILDEKNGNYKLAGKDFPIFKAKRKECDNQKYRIEYPLPPFGIAVFEK